MGEWKDCIHGFVMQINDDDGYPLSKDAECDIRGMQFDQCPEICPDFKPRPEVEKPDQVDAVEDRILHEGVDRDG